MQTKTSKSLLSTAIVFLSATLFINSSAMAEIEDAVETEETNIELQSFPIDQQPLSATKPVPANVAIVGSFEFPTMVTRAYNKGVISADIGEGDEDEDEDEAKENTYYDNQLYVGYFDNQKCYEYKYIKNETATEKSHFYPVNKNGPLCPAVTEWSGNFLNWSTMQTIDIFRHTLTGGHRAVDTEDITILEKGIQTGQGNDNNFPVGKINHAQMANATPVTTWSTFRTRIGQSSTTSKPNIGKFGNKLRFTSIGRLKDWALTPKKVTLYQGGKIDGIWLNTKVYELSVRVKVCDPRFPESNCVEQPNGKLKPVGLIQQYAEEQGTPRMRFSTFGYLNDPSDEEEYGNYRNRKGGVMHARMKYVGPNKADKKNIASANPNSEWFAETGIFKKNPDPVDAANTISGVVGVAPPTITHSGVINYINRSGHIVEGTKFKKRDNVSELYYAAYRYMKGLDNIALYSKLDVRKSGVSIAQLAGGLPIISDWKKDDPIQFSCQKNFILGIGDTITANDWWIEEDGGHDDPVFADNRIKKLRSNMYKREGIDPEEEYYNLKNVKSRKGEGSDNIAIFAYDANTTDMRPDMPGKQTMQTYWIDVLEKGLKPKETNPYWMATKYGGFKVPENFNPVSTNPPSLLESLWWTSGDVLKTNKKNTENKRPDNFFAANGPEGMINSLNQAFKSIQLDQRGGSSSLSLSPTEPDSDAMVYQASYVSGDWTGNLYGYKVDQSTQAINPEPEWDAESQFKNTDWSQRKLYINNGGLTKLVKDNAKTQGLTTEQINYFLGDRSKETDGTLRKRTGILGDIVNSPPVYVGRPRIDAFSTRTFPGTDSYLQFANDNALRPAVVYVAGNDGMLHGFDAKTGAETFAFIPATVAANNLAALSDKNYYHRYYLDGEITVADVYINESWRTVLVGTLGAGGVAKNRRTTNNAVFALDITKPDAISLLWEKSSADIKDAQEQPALGVSLGKPVIIQNTDKQWRVVLGNGPNSSDTAGGKISNASLISLDLFNGSAVVTKVPSAQNNGLSAIRAWDSSGDGFTDTLYAGDLNGNLWKFDASTNASTATKLFTATDPTGRPQPITTMPLVGISPYDRTTWVFFGTGLYLSTQDAVNDQVQSWYGIQDNSTTGKTRGHLLERKIIKDVALNGTGNIKVARVIQSGTRADLESDNKQGWYLDFYSMLGETPLATGERMITPSRFQGGALTGTTRNPNAHDACAIDGAGMTMAIDPFTGARLPDNYFDVNEDGTITAAGVDDMVNIGGKNVVVSGVGFDTGFSDTTVLGNKIYAQTDGGQLVDVKFKSYTSATNRSSWRELINREN